METLLSLSLALIAGLMLSRLAKLAGFAMGEMGGKGND